MLIQNFYLSFVILICWNLFLVGNQSSVELDEKVAQLKTELNKALEENVSLRKEVAALSETSLKPDLEILHKEVKKIM